MKQIILYVMLLLFSLCIIAQERVSDSLFICGYNYYMRNEYDKALPYFQKALSLDSIIYKDKRPQKIIYSGMWLGNTLYKLGKEKEAKKNIYTGLYYKIKPVDPRLMDEADSLSTLAQKYKAENNIMQSIALFEQRKSIVDSILGTQHIWALNSNSILAELYQSLIKDELWNNKYNPKLTHMQINKATAYYMAYLDGLRYNYEENDWNYISELIHAGDFLMPQYGNPQLNIELINKGKNIFLKYYPDSINDLMYIEYKLGEAYEASAGNLAEDDYWELVSNCSDSLKNIKYRTVQRDKYLKKAIEIYTNCANYVKASEGLNTNYVTILQRISECYWNRPTLETDTISFVSDNFYFYNLNQAKNKQDSTYMEEVNNLGIAKFYVDAMIKNETLPKSHIDKAKKWRWEAILLKKNILPYLKDLYGEQSNEYLFEMKELAIYYSLMNEYAEAINIDKQLEALYLKYSMEEELIALYLDLGNESYFAEDYQNAIYYYMKYLKKEDNPTVEAGLASLYYDLGIKFNDKNYFKKAAPMLEKAGNTNSDILYNPTSYLEKAAVCWFESGEFIKAAKYFFDYQNKNTKKILKTFLYANKEHRNRIWETNANDFERSYYRAYITNGLPEYTQMAYDAALLSKGILLNSEISFRTILNENCSNNKIKHIYERWNSVCETIESSFFPMEQSITEADSLERELLLKCKDIKEYNANLKIQWEDIRQSLNIEDIAIEFIDFDNYNNITENVSSQPYSKMYCALLLKKTDRAPHLIPLFTESELLNIKVDNITTIHEALQKTPYAICTVTSLYNLLWNKLSPYLQGIKNIYFSPTGFMHLIPIEYLQDSSHISIGSKYRIHRLSSTREVLNKSATNNYQNIVLYGGLEYDADVKTLIEENKAYNPKDALIKDLFTHNIRSLTLRSGVTSLEGARKEVEDIARTLINIGFGNQNLFTDIKGTEESIKNLSGKRINLLHIATHGFYWTEEEVDKNKELRFVQLGNSQSKPSEEKKELNRCGLLFAGANLALRNEKIPENIDDGILTAQELSRLDFRELNLVVLSACQTGLGEVMADGVFGLQRGFKKAGAKTLLMSLWKVDDTATQLLMIEFYKNLVLGKSKSESFLNAQQYLRTCLNGKYDKPEYWAAFIMLDGIN